jgi:predicted permease
MVGSVLVLNTLAPVFLLIAVGAWLQRSGFVSPGFLKEANRLTYWFGLPALVFSELANSFHQAGGAKWMLLATVVATAIAIVVAYGTAWALRVPGRAMGTFVQGAVRGNLAFIGLPVVFAMPDTTLAGGVSARAAAMVVVGPMMVANNVIGVVVLLLSQHRLGWAMVRPFTRQLITTPPLLATLAGIGFALAGWTLPSALDKALGALGEMALPLGLLGVGGSLMVAERKMLGRASWGAALLKTVAGPALGYVVGRAMGLGATETKMVMIFMATPAAVVSYTMALELKGDEPLAAGSIVLSVGMSIVALAVVLGAF